MAESAVKSSIDVLGKILVEEGKYLWGAEGKVKELRNELLWMRSFLRKAETFQHKDEIVWMWVCQVQEHVYEAEDIIEKFVIRVASRRRQSGFLNKLRRYSCFMRELYYLHRAASSIDSLKDEISTLSPRLEKYGLISSVSGKKGQVEEARIEHIQHILKNAHLEEKKIVGFENNAKEIIDNLTSPGPKRFYAIYRMGGGGKTTLATKVLKHDEVTKYFSGGQAFVYISKQFHVGSVIEEVHTHLKLPKTVDRSLEVQVQEFLKENKCLVVLDDVWKKEDWDCLKSAFALGDGDSGTKVLLTTRNKEVAEHVDSGARQMPDPLKDEDAWELLQRTMGWDVLKASSTSLKQVQDQKKTDGTNDGSKVLLTTSKEDVATSSTQIQDEINTVDSKDVSEKIDLAKKMLKVCDGVPLFIVVLGGILRKKQSLAEWKSVFGNITSHLRTGYDHGRSCTEIVLLSYDDLPYHLKPCFLHLANFPEDYKIPTENLYRMWAAEGLVTRSTYDRTTGTKCLDDVANDYLNDLAQVGLVEIVDATSKGWINSIRMHDLVRDVCYEKAVNDNVLTTVDLRSGLCQEPDSSDYCSMKRLLRMAIYLPAGSIKSLIEDSLSSKAPKYLRSLVLFSSGEGPSRAECQQLMTCICSEFQLLRVLVIHLNAYNFQWLTSQIENLTHLRYLSLADTWILELPSCIGKLRFLEILDLRVLLYPFDKLTVPNTLWKLFRLRHLLFPGWGYQIEGSKRLRVDTLICLEVIENLRLDNLQTKGMRKLKNLRKLSIKKTLQWPFLPRVEKLSKEAIEDIIPAFRSIHLQSCFLEIGGDVIGENPKMLSGILCNFQLNICGRMPGVVMHTAANFPQHLEELELEGCLLEDDPMSILGSLHHLKYLTLTRRSYVGRKLSCHPNGFPLLIKFKFWHLEELEVWELGNGSMPKLNRVWIDSCRKLNRTPDVLPLSLQVFYLSHSGEYVQNQPLENAVLGGKSAKVVLLGKDSEGKTTAAMELYCNKNVNRHFDAVARTWVPRRRSGGGLIPRRKLQQLLRDLRDPKQSRDGQDLPRMSCLDLMTELQQVMQKKKCLVILLNLEVDIEHVQAELEKTFGNPRSYAERGSKLLITSESDIESPLPPAECRQVVEFAPPHFHTWQMICNYDNKSGETNAGIKWNLMRHYLGDQLSAKMFMEVLQRKENITKWAAEHKELIDPSPIEFSQIFTLCYNDLPLHLQRCLVYLANFPEEVEIPVKKLHQMWIAAGIVASKQDDVQLVESLENLASSYLTELVQRGLVYVLKRERDEIAKTCQLKFALRDLCLAKAKEEQKLENSQNPSSLAIQMDQNSVSPASLIEKLSFLEVIRSPTSLLFFPYVNDPLYNEENWEWLLYICNHFQLLRVLDLEGLWLTKGSLPKEIGHLTQLRYLSLRGTWVTQLPQSIEDLSHLQTLDLRVWEPIIIPDVLWKLHRLMHLYLPDFIAQENAKLRLGELRCLETLFNLQTGKVCLTDLLELKLLKKISIRNIHTVEVVDELDGILKQLSTSLEVCINSKIINANPTVLAGFQTLHNLKIKGAISGELQHGMFPANLEEVTLKHTKLEQDPLPVLEKLPRLTRLTLAHESYIGEEMTLSKDFGERATKLVLCSLNSFQMLYSSRGSSCKICISDDCWRAGQTEKEEEEEEDVRTCAGSFGLSSLKKGFKSLTNC